MALVLGFLAALVGTTADADFRSAVQAYASGQFDAAHAQFLALAELGDGGSQFNLGAMALHGQGGPKDIATGVGWLLASVDNGFQGVNPGTLATMQSSLTDAQRQVARDILERYGHAGLLKTVLPSSAGSTCPGVVAARLAQTAPARYPALFTLEQSDGIEIIEVTVGVDGLASDPEVLMAFPTQGFTASAIESMLRSRYTPGTRNGVPLESRTRVRYVFSMTSDANLWNAGALKTVKEAAAAGDPDAEYLTGLAATLDSTVGISASQANQLLLSAAQGGQPDAQYLIARGFEALEGCGGDAKRQIWLQSAATSGDASAQVTLARDLLAGTPSAQDVGRARSLLEEAAQSDRFYVRKHVAALLACSPIGGIRDPATALAVAKKLAKDAVPSDPQMFEVVAAAYAANGDFSSAVSKQKEAVARAKELSWNTSAMEARLAAYRSSQPWLGDLLSVPTASRIPL